MSNRKTPSRIISNSEERNAMRTYLQRAEVRFSTIQRIAGILLNGAGLMILLSTLSSNNLIGEIATFLHKEGASLISYYLFLFIPVLICFGLPFRFLFILLEDLFKFYFAKKLPGEDGSPAFVLPASVLPSDEVNSATRGLINSARTKELYSWNHSLLAEVAHTEFLLDRHVVGLGRLVFKYVNALFVMIWTTFVLFITTALFQFVPFQFLAFAIVVLYMAWGGLTLYLAEYPFRLIEQNWTEQKTSLQPDPTDSRHIKGFIIEIKIHASIAILSGLIFILLKLGIPFWYSSIVIAPFI